MKSRWRHLGLYIAMFTLLAVTLMPLLAHAVGTGGGDAGSLSVSLNPSRSTLEVTAQRQEKFGIDDTLALRYDAGSKKYVTDQIAGTGSDNPGGCSVNAQRTFNIVVKNSRGTELGRKDGQVVNCAPGTTNVTISVRTEQQNNQVGTISGRLRYKNENTGEAKPFGANTNLEIIGPTSKRVSVNERGIFEATGLRPGKYTIKASYQPAESSGGAGAGYFIERSGINVDAGKTTEVDYGVLGTSARGKTVEAAEFDKAISDAKAQQEDQTSCEDIGGWAWLLCPGVKMLESAMGTLDRAVQSLLLVPGEYFTPNSNGETPLKDVWRAMRNLAILILVPVMLVMVISTALGYDFVSAYTVKKALPRFFIAAIFIALSWEVAVFLVNFTNIVGRGILGLITQPVGGFQESSLSNLFTPGVGFFGISLGAVAVGALLGWLGIIFSLAFTLFLVLLTGFMLLSLREVLIIGLVVLAPLAILAWIFPNNDKLWKLWWGSFTKLLMLFPLVMILVGSGRLVASMINDIYSDGLMRVILVLIAYIGPYALIPLTFKFAGGLFANLAGIVNDKERGLFDRQRKRRQQLVAQNWERKAGRPILSARANIAGGLQSAASKHGRGRFSSALLRGAAKGVGGNNIEAAWSARNAAVGKELNEQIATGRDDAIRGLTAVDALEAARANPNSMARYDAANNVWKDGAGNIVDINSMGTTARIAADGTRQYRSAAGRWVDEAHVLEGKQRWGRDVFAKQAALSYEMRKAQTEEETQAVATRWSGLSRSLGMSDRDRDGAWIGAAFENQNQHVEYKNMSYDEASGQFQLNGKKLVNEIYEKKGSYQLAQMGSNTIVQLQEAYTEAQATGDIDTQQKIEDIAETFMHEIGTGGQIGGTNDDPILDPNTGAPGRRQASTQGAAHMAQRVRELAGMTGTATNLNTGTPGSAPKGYHSNPPPSARPTRREQK